MSRAVDSPLGPLHIIVNPSGQLTGLHIGTRPPTPVPPQHRDAGVTNAGVTNVARRALDVASAQLDEYFAGVRGDFDLPVSLEGSAFQRQVWAQLQRIPFGTTVSYGQLASRLGRGSAARAVGHANARNPIPVIIPCHRVIGSSGQLTGYGGGLEAKRYLLGLEALAAPGLVQSNPTRR
jgi:methylated-DNA-[protein]-cysteine S-methyltransferase